MATTQRTDILSAEVLTEFRLRFGVSDATFRQVVTGLRHDDLAHLVDGILQFGERTTAANQQPSSDPLCRSPCATPAANPTLKLLKAQLLKEASARVTVAQRKRTVDDTKWSYMLFHKNFCETFTKEYFPELAMTHDMDTFIACPLTAEALLNRKEMGGLNVVCLFLFQLHQYCTKENEKLGESTVRVMVMVRVTVSFIIFVTTDFPGWRSTFEI